MRYIKATLLIGTASALAVLLLYATGFLTNTPDAVLQKALALKKPLLLPQLGQILLFTFLAFAFAWTTVDITRPALKTIVACTAMFLFATSTQVLALLNVYFNPLPSIAAILFSFLIGLAYGQGASGARKRIIERLFNQRVSRGAFSRLVNSNIPADFPGEKIEGSILICEIQNQAELIELLEPANYAAMTNLYLQTASDYLVEVGGYLDECTGESLRVVFGAPVPDEAHAAKACRAALDLLARLDILNKECDATWQRRFEFRMGVNSGAMIAAAYGGSRLASYSVAGPAVEFARRLSAACSVYGCRILIGPETFEAAADGFEVRPIEVLRNLGPLRRAELYEILAPKHGLSSERERSRDHFWRGVIYFREGKWNQAVDEFQQARITGIPDPALDFYISRVEKARRGAADLEREQAMLFERI